MLTISATNCEYKLKPPPISGGTYHELTLVTKGTISADITQVAYLPIDITTWTAQQKLDAATFITTYGEKIDAGARYATRCAQTGPLYSYVAANTAVAHVMVG